MRPADRLPPPPQPDRAPAEEPELAPPLPPSPTPAPPDDALVLRVDAFEVTGSTVFEAADLAALLAPWTGRALSTAELLAARDAITSHYVDAGYLTSGATLPDQDVEDGVVEIEIVEGRLTNVTVTGNEWFRASYFESRLAGAAGTPVDAFAVERTLQIIQRHPRIERVEARLVPGAQRGESEIELSVIERRPITAAVRASNELSPAIGAYAGGVHTTFTNPIGVGDAWTLDFTGGAGLIDVGANVSIPVTRWDTTFTAFYRHARSEIVEADFGAVDIVSNFDEVGINIAQPLVRRGGHEAWAGLDVEYRRSKSFVERVAFCFEVATPDCNLEETVLRPALSYVYRDANDAFALNGVVSFGVDVLEVVEPDEPSDGPAVTPPDGRFIAFLGQASWAHVFDGPLRDPTLVMRVDMQFANSPLLSIERLAIGGMRTVRGYTENALVRDQGVIASAELRIPIQAERLDARRYELVAFMDFGHGWNVKAPVRSDSIWSAGLGLSATPFPWLALDFYWGMKLLEPPFETNDALQSNGIHFSAHLLTF